MNLCGTMTTANLNIVAETKVPQRNKWTLWRELKRVRDCVIAGPNKTVAV